MNLLEKMKVSINTMTMGEKFLASIQVTILGLLIVFVALAVLYFAIVAMDKLINRPKQAKSDSTVQEASSIGIIGGADGCTDIEEDPIHNTELIAVITAAVAASFDIPAQNVVIRKIKRVEDPTPIWAKMGRMEQINNML